MWSNTNGMVLHLPPADTSIMRFRHMYDRLTTFPTLSTGIRIQCSGSLIRALTSGEQSPERRVTERRVGAASLHASLSSSWQALPCPIQDLQVVLDVGTEKGKLAIQVTEGVLASLRHAKYQVQVNLPTNIHRHKSSAQVVGTDLSPSQGCREQLFFSAY